MPNRDLKESNRRSPSLQLLSDAAERLWYRLITSVDDFGRLEADPEVVFTTCFQRVPKGWTARKVHTCLNELASKAISGDHPLISIYHVGSRSYLEILSSKRHIQQRSKKSKYPDPINQQLTESCEQVRADTNKCAQIPSYPVSRIPYPDSPNPVSRIPYPDLRKLRKNEDEEGEPTKAQAQAIGRVDEFHITPELEAWSTQEGILNPGQYVDEFKDYWRSAGGKRKSGQPIKDWAATFRNQLRKLKDLGRLKNPDWKKEWEEQT